MTEGHKGNICEVRRKSLEELLRYDIHKNHHSYGTQVGLTSRKQNASSLCCHWSGHIKTVVKKRLKCLSDIFCLFDMRKCKPTSTGVHQDRHSGKYQISIVTISKPSITTLDKVKNMSVFASA